MGLFLTSHAAPDNHQQVSWMAGFTLIEVMVALAILTIGLTGIYRLQSQTILMSATARFYSLAPLLAQAKLAEIDRTPQAIHGDESGEFGPDYPGYTWRLSTEQVALDLLANKPYQMLRIDLTVALNDEDSYVLRTYRFYEE
jgi:prepilin-type N-terminal cleavage/methylation domain-containing protein